MLRFYTHLHIELMWILINNRKCQRYDDYLVIWASRSQRDRDMLKPYCDFSLTTKVLWRPMWNGQSWANNHLPVSSILCCHYTSWVITYHIDSSNKKAPNDIPGCIQFSTFRPILGRSKNWHIYLAINFTLDQHNCKLSFLPVNVGGVIFWQYSIQGRLNFFMKHVDLT